MKILLVASIAVASFIGGLEYEIHRSSKAFVSSKNNLEGCEFIASQIHKQLMEAEDQVAQCDEIFNNLGRLGDVEEP